MVGEGGGGFVWDGRISHISSLYLYAVVIFEHNTALGITCMCLCVCARARLSVCPSVCARVAVYTETGGYRVHSPRYLALRAEPRGQVVHSQTLDFTKRGKRGGRARRESASERERERTGDGGRKG
jgi:hypothetical protein